MAGIFGGAVPAPAADFKPSAPAAEGPQAPAAAASATKDRISQVEIALVLALEEDVKRRKAIIEARLREGAGVEPGMFRAAIESSERKESVTKKFLTEQLGKEPAEALWGKLQKKPYDVFRVGLASEGKHDEARA
jgi:hypothetical protein